MPYRLGGVQRHYRPDFIVRIDDGHDDPLNLVIGIKGFRGEDAITKADTMATEWVPGVNALGTSGRWAFAEFRSAHDMEAEFKALIESVVFFSIRRRRAAASGGGELLAPLSGTDGDPPREGDEMP